MGLDTTHGAWNGAYSAFMRWRSQIAIYCGLGDLNDYSGYGGAKSLNTIQDEGIRILLSHSDCDGELTPEECYRIADSLKRLLNSPINVEYLGGHIGCFRDKTQTFIYGCMLAYEKNESIRFE